MWFVLERLVFWFISLYYLSAELWHPLRCLYCNCFLMRSDCPLQLCHKNNEMKFGPPYLWWAAGAWLRREKKKGEKKKTAHKRMIKSKTKEKHLAIKIALNLVRLNLLNKHKVNQREGNGSERCNGVKEMEVPKTQRLACLSRLNGEHISVLLIENVFNSYFLLPEHV